MITSVKIDDTDCMVSSFVICSSKVAQSMSETSKSIMFIFKLNNVVSHFRSIHTRDAGDYYLRSDHRNSIQLNANSWHC